MKWMEVGWGFRREIQFETMSIHVFTPDWNRDLITRLCISARLMSRPSTVSTAWKCMSAFQNSRGETKPHLWTTKTRYENKSCGSAFRHRLMYIQQMVPSCSNNPDWDIDLISNICICACVISRAFAVSSACQYTSVVQDFRYETISCLWTSQQRQHMKYTLNTNKNINLLQRVLGDVSRMQVHEKEKEVLNVLQDTLARESAPVEKTSQRPGSPKED